jgi:pimeloyl-ACP methyl ester carboxylesterase
MPISSRARGGADQSAAGVPVRAINAEANPPMRPATTIELSRKYGDFDAVFIEDVGDFLQLERPAQFNTHLRNVLAELERK